MQSPLTGKKWTCIQKTHAPLIILLGHQEFSVVSSTGNSEGAGGGSVRFQTQLALRSLCPALWLAISTGLVWAPGSRWVFRNTMAQSLSSCWRLLPSRHGALAQVLSLLRVSAHARLLRNAQRNSAGVGALLPPERPSPAPWAAAIPTDFLQAFTSRPPSSNGSVVVLKINHNLPLMLWISMWYEDIYGAEILCTDLSQKFTHRLSRKKKILDINDGLFFFFREKYIIPHRTTLEVRLLQLHIPRSNQ